VANIASLAPVGSAKCVEAHKELYQYNSALAEYGRLKDLSEMYPNLASRFIIEQYSRQPNDAELQQFLTQYVASDKDRRAILEAVEAN
jgi:hypothetical protein